MNKEKQIAIIKQRIIDEHKKHKSIDWVEIAARKIYSTHLAKEKCNTPVVTASDFLISRKLPYGNTMRAIFRKNPQFTNKHVYHMCETFLHEGYMLAVRRLKNNSL